MASLRSVVYDLEALVGFCAVGFDGGETTTEGLTIDKDVLDVGLLLVGLTGIAHDHQFLLRHHLPIKQVAQRETIGYPLLLVSFLLPIIYVLVGEGNKCQFLLPRLIFEVQFLPIDLSLPSREEILEVGILGALGSDGLAVGLLVALRDEPIFYVHEHLHLVCEPAPGGTVDVVGAGEGDILGEHDCRSEGVRDQPAARAVPVSPQEAHVVMDVPYHFLGEAGGGLFSLCSFELILLSYFTRVKLVPNILLSVQRVSARRVPMGVRQHPE